MALASTLVDDLCSTPLVIDATPEVRQRPAHGTTLGQWPQQMHKSDLKRGSFSVRHAADKYELDKIIDEHVRDRFSQFGTVLIDTGGRLDELALTAIAHSKLLIAPFMDALTALR